MAFLDKVEDCLTVRSLLERKKERGKNAGILKDYRQNICIFRNVKIGLVSFVFGQVNF